MTDDVELPPVSVFYEPLTDPDRALPVASDVIERCRDLAPGVEMLISDPPLACAVCDLTPERLLTLVSLRRVDVARGIVEFFVHLQGEVRPGRYFLDELIRETEALPAFATLTQHQLSVFRKLRRRGCRFSVLPESPRDAQEALLKISKAFGISLEYVLGNLDKAIRLLELAGVRSATLNVSSLFHNARSGLLDVTVAERGDPIGSADLVARARRLEEQGVTVTLFKSGVFNDRLAALDPADVDHAISEAEDAYEDESADFIAFVDACMTAEEQRLAGAPVLSIPALLACFRFPATERDAVALPAVIPLDDPLRWRETELGKALMALHDKLSWLAISIGAKAAGDLEAHRDDPTVRARIDRIKDLAGGFAITLLSGRSGGRTEPRIRDLGADQILFDLYCLAVLEKTSLGEVLDTTVSILQVIRELENRDPVVNLNPLISSRLAGESYATLLGTQGLVLRNLPIVKALERLRGLSDKVRLTVQSVDGNVVPLEEIGVDDFRRAIILMGRRFRVPHSPERVLGTIHERVVPQILHLPAEVIDRGPHDLGQIVELAVEGVPARYPLRRPWRKIDLDQLVGLGNCLDPGIRNCLGCPVNTLYGQVTKTALALGFDEIITYEATGCFEVYSGIWPYTGKRFPSVHGVFGAAPSEMLGGLAAKRARLRHAMKNGGGSGNGGSSGNGDVPRILHLGWGGDGATFDIGFGNLSGLFSRLQKISDDELGSRLRQRALYVCYDNEGYQNTGNQYSAATGPGGNTTTNPAGRERTLGNDLRKKPIVEIVAEHGVPLSARMNIHRPEHISRVVERALEDGSRGSFLHFLQPCTTGWKFTTDSVTYELSHLSEEGGLFPPVTIEHGVAYLEIYPTRRDPAAGFLELQARFRHLLGRKGPTGKDLERVLGYYRSEWERNLRLAGYDDEIPQADRLGYLTEEHRSPRVS